MIAETNSGGLFVPHELKTIEVDAEKKMFRINGEDFGKDCTGFTIHCDGGGRFRIRVEIETTVHFANYESGGMKTGDGAYETDAPWFSPAVTESDKED